MSTRFGPVLTLAAVVAVAGLAAGCSSNRVVGSGPAQTQQRDTAAFSKLDVGWGIGVTVTVGPAASLSVEAPANIQPIIATRVVGDTLTIGGTREFSVQTPVQVVVTTPSLEGLDVGGGSNITIANIASTVFGIDVSGGGRIAASGTAGLVAIDASGGAQLDLASLQVGTVTVDLSGGTTADVRGAESVMGSASGGARVVVSNTAKVAVDASGGGAVDRR
jgi:hypothetical protein